MTYGNGQLKTLNKLDENGYGFPIMEFDEAGYLTYYVSPDMWYVTYTYD